MKINKEGALGLAVLRVHSRTSAGTCGREISHFSAVSACDFVWKKIKSLYLCHWEFPDGPQVSAGARIVQRGRVSVTQLSDALRFLFAAHFPQSSSFQGELFSISKIPDAARYLGGFYSTKVGTGAGCVGWRGREQEGKRLLPWRQSGGTGEREGDKMEEDRQSRAG